MDAHLHGRIQLWLRSERAWGMKFVPASSAIQETHAKPPAAPRLAPAPAAARLVAPKGEGGMFADVGAPNQMAPFGGLVAPPAKEPFSLEVLPREEKIARLIAMDANEVRGCTRCRLCETRIKTVFGEGDADAAIFFIGEGPGENEDKSGRPFVGRAGDLLNRQIAAMGLRREQVYIANIVKCRPPGNRAPAPDEVATCTPYLQRQLEIIRPKVIVTLGLPAATYMLNSKTSMSRLRGNWHVWRGIKLMPTFHPAYVLRQYTEEVRAAVWSDLKQVMKELGLPIPKRTPSNA